MKHSKGAKGDRACSGKQLKKKELAYNRSQSKDKEEKSTGQLLHKQPNTKVSNARRKGKLLTKAKESPSQMTRQQQKLVRNITRLPTGGKVCLKEPLKDKKGKDVLQKLSENKKEDIAGQEKELQELEAQVNHSQKQSEDKCIQEITLEEQLKLERQRITDLQSQLKANEQEMSAMAEELSDTRGQIQVKDRNMADLQKEIDARQQQLTDMESQLSTKDEEIRITREKLTNFDRRGEILRRKQQRVRDLQSQLRTNEQQMRAMEQEIIDLRTQLEEKDTNVAILQGEVRAEHQRVADLQSQFRTNEQEMRVMEKEMVDLRTQLEVKDTDLVTVQGELSAEHQRVVDLQRQLTTNEQEMRAMEQQMTDLREQLEEKDTDLVTVQGELSAEHQRVADLQRQLTTNEQEMRAMEQQMTDLREQLEEKDTNVATLQGEVREEHQRVAALENQLRINEQRLMTDLREEGEEQHVLRLREANGEEEENAAKNSVDSPDWIIDRNEIEISGKQLGKGGWGTVAQGKYRRCAVAVKQLYDAILSPENINIFLREMNMASRCRHPCLLQFIGATNDKESPLFVTELMERSLRALLEERQLTDTEVSVICLDVACALNYLHQKTPFPIIHRDISSANVLLWRQHDKWRGKVSDYGTANFIQQSKTIAPGAQIYSAPEALTIKQTTKVSLEVIASI